MSVSAAAAWEIFLKKSLGKLDAPDDLEGALGDAGFDQLFITIRHAERTSHLPAIHQDPFDLMQIAQAQVEGLLLVTRDETVMRYDVPVIRAGRPDKQPPSKRRAGPPFGARPFLFKV